MFDIGFPELLIIGVVSLIVIGPEQLPQTIRSIALWVGRFKKGFSDLRSEIERGIGADEIKQQLHNEAILKEIEKSKAAIAQTTQYAISCKLRKKVEMLFAHLKRILGLNRLRLRGPNGARDEFHLAATAQNLRKLAKLLPVPEVAC